jgi:hypothetical protein
MGRERMSIGSIDAVVDQDLMKGLEYRLSRSQIRERILDLGYQASRRLRSPLRRIDIKYGAAIGGLRPYRMDIYGTDLEVIRGLEFST